MIKDRVRWRERKIEKSKKIQKERNKIFTHEPGQKNWEEGKG